MRSAQQGCKSRDVLEVVHVAAKTGVPRRKMATFAFAIDRGGTFTDVYAEWCEGGKRCCRVLKLLSDDPSNYPDAPTEGIRRILEDVTGVPHPRGVPVDTSRIASIRMGTTVATNALLERNGARVALVITAGFRDLLYIGNQSRPKLFDLRIQQPDVLYERVIELDERLLLLQEPHTTAPEPWLAPADPNVHRAITGEAVVVERSPDLGALRAELLEARKSGIDAVAVVLTHAYAFDAHERAVGALAHELGFTQVPYGILCGSVVVAVVWSAPSPMSSASPRCLM